MNDCADPRTVEPGLEEAGFETIDLSGNAKLQEALEAVRGEDHVSDAAGAAVRESLNGAWFRLASIRTAEICASGGHWRSSARAAMDGVIRRSIEMRLVATLTSD